MTKPVNPIPFDNTYVNLPDGFHAPVAPSVGKAPRLLAFNDALAEELGIAGLDEATAAAIFSGQVIPEGAEPVALAYAGHQFGNFVPQLGDGRALLLGEVVDRAGHRRDLQLKGSGQTPFSRRGDGRSSLGPVVREYIVSEAMHALGVPTTRALAAVATGETVYREAPLPGGVMTRVAASHIRIGTFEFFAARRRVDDLRALADYAIARHYPEVADEDEPYLRFFEAVAHRTLSLVARWMGLGFIHGVMNTDNTAIAGQTLDFGPCAFIDTFERDKVFSSIDHYGRYRYANQGRVAVWNLSVLANCLVPIIDEDVDAAVGKLTALLDGFGDFFETERVRVFGAKLGIDDPGPDDLPLVEACLDQFEKAQLDFTNGFRTLVDTLDADTGFHAAWRERLGAKVDDPDALRAETNRVNPWIIPRNHRVEQAIDAAIAGDTKPFLRLNAALADPYTVREEFADLTAPPRPDEEVHQTFCGT